MSSLILGIDPGLATGGLVLIRSGATDSDDEILEAVSLVDKKSLVEKDKKEVKALVEERNNWGDKQFTIAVLRAQRWSKSCIKAIKELENKYGKIDYIGIESFVDQPGRAKTLMQLRWQTPLLMGILTVALAELGYSFENGKIFYQNAGIVIKQWSFEIETLKNSQKNNRARKNSVILKGDECITNDHLRKALVHALALSIRMRQVSQT